MSKASEETIPNFEELYYSLKEEFDQMQNENNEIFKEYESTIQILTESITQLQNQRNIIHLINIQPKNQFHIFPNSEIQKISLIKIKTYTILI